MTLIARRVTAASCSSPAKTSRRCGSAYAQHVYRQQGATVDRSVVVTGGWQTSKESAYVEATRAREAPTGSSPATSSASKARTTGASCASPTTPHQPHANTIPRPPRARRPRLGTRIPPHTPARSHPRSARSPEPHDTWTDSQPATRQDPSDEGNSRAAPDLNALLTDERLRNRREPR